MIGGFPLQALSTEESIARPSSTWTHWNDHFFLEQNPWNPMTSQVVGRWNRLKSQVDNIQYIYIYNHVLSVFLNILYDISIFDVFFVGGPSSGSSGRLIGCRTCYWSSISCCKIWLSAGQTNDDSMEQVPKKDGVLFDMKIIRFV